MLRSIYAEFVSLVAARPNTRTPAGGWSKCTGGRRRDSAATCTARRRRRTRVGRQRDGRSDPRQHLAEFDGPSLAYRTDAPTDRHAFRHLGVMIECCCDRIIGTRIGLIRRDAEDELEHEDSPTTSIVVLVGIATMRNSSSTGRLHL